LISAKTLEDVRLMTECQWSWDDSR